MTRTDIPAGAKAVLLGSLAAALVAFPSAAGAAEDGEAAAVADEIVLAKEDRAKPSRVIKRTPCLLGRKQARLAKKLRRIPCGASGGQARGDFNNDGFADLAIGAPGESFTASEVGIGSRTDPTEFGQSGAVHVLYGAANGIAPDKNPPPQFFTMKEAPVYAATAQRNAHYGRALASGDFDGDGFGDLAIGAPGAGVRPTEPNQPAPGGVKILFGSANGLQTQRTQAINMQILDPTFPTGGENFGAALAWGQFGGGPEADLAIGAPGAGLVAVLLGKAGGLDTTGARIFFLGDLFDIPNASTHQHGTRFGDVLTGGDFDANGFADLAIGVPGLTLVSAPGSPEADISGGALPSAGAVVTLPGEKTGITGEGAEFFRQGREGLADSPEPFDRFGEAVTAGDTNGDGFADLAVGVLSEDGLDRFGDKIIRTGAVHVIRGSSSGLDTGASSFVRGDEDNGFFGAALVTGNLAGDGVADLVVGAPGSSLSPAIPGTVYVFYGTTGADVLAGQRQAWHLNSAGVAGDPNPGAGFGSALTAWNFGRGPEMDLAVGVPGSSVGTATRAGGISVLYGSPGSLTATNSAFFNQNTKGIQDAAETGDVFGTSAY